MELSTDYFTNINDRRRRARILQADSPPENNDDGGAEEGDDEGFDEDFDDGFDEGFDEDFDEGNDGEASDIPTDDNEIVITRATFLTLSDIDETSLIEDWLFDILYSVVYDNDYVVKSQNHILEDPCLLLTVRKLVEHENKDSNTNSIFPIYLSNKVYAAYDKLGGEAYTENITLDSGTVIPYTEERSENTLIGGGGYLLGIPRNRTLADQIGNTYSN
jgi:hypothetical protein